ncbi:hypothetical protein SLEP1_g51917 [Rubroshorea leprosula]|uniref:Uncharacterized protein n=1 Tax=Rubroshorea leprosula TaxID=152421 RepID=A0AAV5M8E5_9ROSI|nr:hypothetical protein SLEP1_g51917 [Rubroshorea leprosula]
MPPPSLLLCCTCIRLRLRFMFRFIALCLCQFTWFRFIIMCLFGIIRITTTIISIMVMTMGSRRERDIKDQKDHSASSKNGLSKEAVQKI